MANTILELTGSHAASHGIPTEREVQLAKALRVMARKLDRDAGVTDTNYEAIVDALVVSDDPTTVVP